MFENVSFIKSAADAPASFTNRNFAPQFRKRFTLKSFQNAKLFVCGLGYGYYYLNGKSVSDDLFTAPVSNYQHTLWYNVYDVTQLLNRGENVIAAWCGNGWYNEDFKTSWDFDCAEWRDVPKVIIQLEVDGEPVLSTDATWKCSVKNAVWFNALRSGEYFDARIYDDNWNTLEYDDSGWETAVIDTNQPRGAFRQCLCEPIREIELLSVKNVQKTGDKKYVFDFGQNISGYVRLKAAGVSGQLLTIRYAEQLKDDGSRELNDMPKHYPESEFQTDRFICSGTPVRWSPKFTYHGFRFIEVSGLNCPDDITIQAVFVHQSVGRRTTFECSDPFLNQLFHAGIYATWSNMFYLISDCPTREKLGWANDAQASAEQILTNFHAENLLEKWLQDIYDAMRPNGALPGYIPTAGKGYSWGNGPVSDGVLFEIPYRIYLHTANAEPLKKSIPYFTRYLEYLNSMSDQDGFPRFGLDDWARPHKYNEETDVPVEFINALLTYHFYQILIVAKQLSGELSDAAERQCERLKNKIIQRYICVDGSCKINKQTAVAMMIYYDVYVNLLPLKKQLKRLVEEHDFHHDCGMVGLRRLYLALNKCGLEEYAYKIVTAAGYPSYRAWFEQEATTLWEYWNCEDHIDSKNHQMYSDVLSWLVKTIMGISQKEGSVGMKIVCVKPYYFEQLDYAMCTYDTASGKLSVSWQKSGKDVNVSIAVPDGMTVLFHDEVLTSGNYKFRDIVKESCK